jgi:6-phosphofructokinase 1
MGRHTGYIALHTGIGSGASSIFLPEIDNNIDELSKMLTKSAKRKKLFNLVIVAEGNKNGNAMEIASKIKELNPEYDTKVTIIGHLQRGGSPSCLDRVLSARLGFAAVNALLAGKSGIALGVVNDKISYTSFEDAINKTKVLNKDLVKMAEILAL